MGRPDLARALAKRMPGHYLQEPWEVQFEAPPTGAAGDVHWERGRGWVIRLRPDLRGRGLLRVLLHEVAHVRLGHCEPGDPAPTVGKLTPLEAAIAREVRKAQDDEATAWADRELPRWLAGLEKDL